MRRRLLPAHTAVFVLLLAAPPAFALKSDREQPINIKAARVEVDQKTGINRYLGRVVLTQGSLKITADKVTVRYRDNVILSVDARGRPVTFSQRLDKSPGEIKGDALRLRYDAQKNTLDLYERVRVDQGRDHFTSQVLHYDIANGRIEAEGKDGGARVFSVLQPRKRETAAPGARKP